MSRLSEICLAAIRGLAGVNAKIVRAGRRVSSGTVAAGALSKGTLRALGALGRAGTLFCLLSICFYTGYRYGGSATEGANPSLRNESISGQRITAASQPDVVQSGPVSDQPFEVVVPQTGTTPTVEGLRGPVRPIDGEITSKPDWARDVESGDWIYSYDVVVSSASSGTVRSLMSGAVETISRESDGLVVSVSYDDGITVRYKGLSGIVVTEGDSVSAGEVIGSATATEPGRYSVTLLGTRDGEPFDVSSLIR